jgi:thiosulfate dehydrogenase
MSRRTQLAVAIALIAASACGQRKSKLDQATSGSGSAGATATATATGSAADGVKTQVQLCDNVTTVALDQLPKTRGEGQAVADQLMDQWRRQHPDQEWEAAVRRSWSVKPPADNSSVLQGDQAAGASHGRYTKLDVLAWARESERAAMEGARVFHSGDELGSTISVSCDMCHPDAANTHPETYPKFQVQLGRVALLRDMINWCLQHPVRAPQMSADDPRMRAMEAYILAQRQGTPLTYGKH